MHNSVTLLQHTFIFKNIKPFSVNASYIRTGHGVSKSSGATEWCAQFFNLMQDEEKQVKFKEFREFFNESQHAYKVEMTAYYTPDVYFTKKQIMSNRTCDCTNFEKIVLDCLMLPKFHEEVVPYGCQNLNYDDRFVFSVPSTKLPALKPGIKVVVSIVDKPEIIQAWY